MCFKEHYHFPDEYLRNTQKAKLVLSKGLRDRETTDSFFFTLETWPINVGGLDILEYLYSISACLLWNLLEQKKIYLKKLAHNCFYNEDLNFLLMHLSLLQVTLINANVTWHVPLTLSKTILIMPSNSPSWGCVLGGFIDN